MTQRTSLKPGGITSRSSLKAGGMTSRSRSKTGGMTQRTEREPIKFNDPFLYTAIRANRRLHSHDNCCGCGTPECNKRRARRSSLTGTKK